MNTFNRKNELKWLNNLISKGSVDIQPELGKPSATHYIAANKNKGNKPFDGSSFNNQIYGKQTDSKQINVSKVLKQMKDKKLCFGKTDKYGGHNYTDYHPFDQSSFLSIDKRHAVWDNGPLVQSNINIDRQAADLESTRTDLEHSHINNIIREAIALLPSIVSKKAINEMNVKQGLPPSQFFTEKEIIFTQKIIDNPSLSFETLLSLMPTEIREKIQQTIDSNTQVAEDFKHQDDINQQVANLQAENQAKLAEAKQEEEAQAKLAEEKQIQDDKDANPPDDFPGYNVEEKALNNYIENGDYDETNLKGIRKGVIEIFRYRYESTDKKLKLVKYIKTNTRLIMIRFKDHLKKTSIIQQTSSPSTDDEKVLSEGTYADEIKATVNQDKSNKSRIISSANVISNNETGRAIMHDKDSRSIIWGLVKERAKDLNREYKESTNTELGNTLKAFLHVNADGSPALYDYNKAYPKGDHFITWNEVSYYFSKKTNTRAKFNYYNLTFTKI